MSIQLNISDLHVSVQNKEILKGVTLRVNKGEVHAIMGPNGSGKSTLAQVLFGHPNYSVTQGSIEFKDQNIINLSPDKRSHLGLFIAFQSPQSVPGVNIATFLKQAVNAQRRANDTTSKSLKIREYRELLSSTMEELKIPPEFADRYLNAGFSGGEKKKSEILQMAMLKPDIAILDEIDSGLDVDALRVVCENILKLKNETGMGVLVITHYPRILKYVQPDAVHLLMNGRIVKSGDASLAHTVEERGYDWLMEPADASPMTQS